MNAHQRRVQRRARARTVLWLEYRSARYRAIIGRLIESELARPALLVPAGCQERYTVPVRRTS